MLNKTTLQSYFEKLDINPTDLTLSLVKNLQQKHLEHFSFNNIAVLFKEEISLDIDDIINKIVHNNRGGYCFEHNKLMHDALYSLGFNVRILLARVINNQDIDAPKTHRMTLLEINNIQYIVDVGFGPTCPSSPIQINKLDNHTSKYKIIKNNYDDYVMQLLIKDDYFSLYTFTLSNDTGADCIMGNFYSSNYPKAVFLNNLVISLILPTITLSLRNNQYHKISENKSEVVSIENATQLHSIINNEFNISLNQDNCNQLFEIIIVL